MGNNQDPSAAPAPFCLPPAPINRRPGFALPALSCDSHMHVFGPPAEFPLAAVRNYTPSIRRVADCLGMMAALGIARGVLVQPSVYGTDNAALTAALADHGDRFRGIVVVPPTIGTEELHRLHRLGVRGIRINRRNPGGLGLEAIGALGARIAPLGWHIQLQVSLEAVEDLDDLCRHAPVPLVIDHLGFADPQSGIAAPGFRRLLAALGGGQVWVKLSAPYRVSRMPPPFADLGPLIAALADRRPDRLLWASDWPHTELWQAMPDSADLVDLIPAWLPDAGLRQAVLVDNPARLYWDGLPTE